MELTREQFAEKINSLNEQGATFNVESEDTGSIYLSLYGCNMSVTLEEGVCGEIDMFKPHTEMGVSIDFDLVNGIEEDEVGVIYLIMNNGLADVAIKAIS